MNECVFCQVINNPPSYTVYSDSSFVVIPDRGSLGFGHCIVIPKIHFGKIYEMDDKEYNKLFNLAKKLSLALEKLPQNPHYRSFPNTGGLSPVPCSVAFTVFNSGAHYHLHLVPHNNPDVLLNPEKHLKNLDDDEIEKEAKLIRDFINSHLY